MYNIRRATKDDKDGILEVSRNIWDGEDYVPIVVDKWLDDELGELTVVENEEKKVVGFVKTDILREGEYWLQGIRVHPDFRGEGLGKMMTEYLVNTIKARGYKTMELSTYVEDEGSVHIIEKYGFKRTAAFKIFFTRRKERRNAKNYELAESVDEIKGVLDSEEMRAAKGYLSFDWVFVRAGEDILKKLIDRKEVYVLREGGKVKSTVILSDYMKKDNAVSIVYLDGEEHYEDAVDFAINEFSKGSHDVLRLKAPKVESLRKAAVSAGMERDSDTETDDAFVYGYPD